MKDLFPSPGENRLRVEDRYTGKEIPDQKRQERDGLGQFSLTDYFRGSRLAP